MNENEREHVRRVGGSNSVVESQPSKLLVAGSIPVSRSIPRRLADQPSQEGCRPAIRTNGTQADLSAEAPRAKADVAQLAERVLGKDEVTGSIPVIGSRE